MSPLVRPGRVRAVVGRHPLVAFFVLAYGLSWTAWVPYILSENGQGVWAFRFPGVLGQLAGIGPGVYLGPFTAAFVVTALADGRAGLRIWRARLLRWRVGGRWYAFALLGVPLIVGPWVLVMPGALASVQAPGTGILLLAVGGLIGQALTSGLGEEPGWRDFALPRIQDRIGPFRGSLVLGALWGGWHLPLFWTDWAHAGPDPATMAGFVLGAVAFSIVITWAFNRSGQSLPITILMHASSNNTVTVLGIAMFPAIAPHASFLSPSLLGMGVAAAVLVVATRGRLGYRAPTRPGQGRREGQASNSSTRSPARYSSYAERSSSPWPQ